MSGSRTEPSVIAIVHEEDRLRAVEVQKGLAGLQVVWAKSSPSGRVDWSEFAAECGLSVGRPQATKDPTHAQLVIGLGPVGVAFYRLRLPVVGESEMEAMIRMQAETRLPLSADQMELAWRIADRGPEEMTVILAATRRRHIQSLVDQVRPLRPDRLVLSSEGLVKAWTTLFADSKQDDAVVISMEARSTHVCLVEAGMLGHLAMIDVGTEDLVGEHLGVPSYRTDQAGGQTEIEERFVQDLKGILEGFRQPSRQHAWPVAVLSDGSPVLEYVVGLLRGAGLEAMAAMPRARTIQATLTPGQWYEYKTALGLAVMMVESSPPAGRAAGLDLFMNLYRPPGEEQARTPVLSSRTASVIAAAALVGALLISYVTDLALASRLKGLVEEHKVVELKAQRDARQSVARYRPDILALLKEINTGATEGGIVLDSLHFKRGQAVQLIGQADKPEPLYAFEQALLKKDGIRSVKIDKSVPDNQTKKVKFTVTLQYKDFTQKGARS